jgi:hypothetical protein
MVFASFFIASTSFLIFTRVLSGIYIKDETATDSHKAVRRGSIMHESGKFYDSTSDN